MPADLTNAAGEAVARLGSVLDDLPPWPGTWIGPVPPAAPWQPVLFPRDDQGG